MRGNEPIEAGCIARGWRLIDQAGVGKDIVELGLVDHIGMLGDVVVPGAFD